MLPLHLTATFFIVSRLAAFSFGFEDGGHLPRPRLPPPLPRVGAIFNSSSSLQYKLYLSTWMAFRDTIPDEPDEPAIAHPPPHILDVSKSSSLQDAATWIAGNQTRRIVSLLESEQLTAFLDAYKQIATDKGHGIEPLLIALPRECVHVHDNSSPFRLVCLQPDLPAIAVALVHRAAKLGVTRLLPVSLRPSSNRAGSTHEMYRTYKEAVHRHRLKQVTSTNSSTPLRLEPIALGLERISAEIRIQNKIAGLRVGYANGTSTNASAHVHVLGLLIIDRDAESLERVLEAVTSVHDGTGLIYTFTPWGVDPMLDIDGTLSLALAPFLKELPYVNRLYTVVGARGIQTSGPERMRVMHELNEFIGPSAGPLILTAVAAYDAAVDLARDSTQEMAETLEMDHATFYGVSPKPGAAIAASDGALLQQSDFVLEDIQEVARGDDGTFRVSEYRVATSSVISRHDLMQLATAAEARINCSEPLLQVTSYDPFNVQPHVYRFGTGTLVKETVTPLPHFLIIPNMYGYGLELECVHRGNAQESLVTNLRIACTPTLTRDGDSVNCYRANWSHRVKRSQLAQRDDHGYANPLGMLMDYMAIAPPTPMPMSSPKPHSTTKPGPPPPDLRTVIKAAKPFVWGCVGSSLGCAMCVLVLGRLPALGPSPATCAGPCFTGVYGQCGALLGRVESETTIICTELFRQGYIDVETFMADAEFGRQMARRAPFTVRGYRVLATPVVYAMRASPVVTKLVSYAAKPWAKYMKSLVDGKSLDTSASDSDWIGAWIHAMGVPICTIVGHLTAGSPQATWTVAVLGGVFGFILARRHKT